MTPGNVVRGMENIYSRETAAGLAALQKALGVVGTARRLVADLPYHTCRGPSCLLCMELPDALAAFDDVEGPSAPGEMRKVASDGRG